MKKDEDVIAAIFRKLFVMKKIGAAHTPVENIQKSFPKHERGYVNKKVIPKILKEGFLLMKRHVYGFGVSLNPEKIEYVRKVLKKNFPDQFGDD